MSNSQYNTLPEERIQDLKKEYLFRFVTIAALGVCIVAFSGVVIVSPTLYILMTKKAGLTAELAVYTSKNASTTDTAISNEISLVRDQMKTLSEKTKNTLSTEIITVLGRQIPRGITIKTVTSSSVEGKGSLVLSGIADTRADLVLFRDNLEGTIPFEKVDLPVSVLAKNSAVPFTLTVTGSF